MSLFVPAPDWGYVATNIVPASGANFGTGFTCAANNVDGTAVQILSALAYDIEYLQIGFTGISVAAANGRALADLLYDPAGGTSWAELVPDLLAGFSLPAGTQPGGKSFHFPIFIPAGSTVGIRGRTAHTSDISGRAHIMAYGGNRNPSTWWCGRSVETIGINAASSSGTNHTPGASLAFSTWADFGSPLTKTCRALQFAIGGSDATASGLAYSFEFGAGSTRIGPPIYALFSTSENAAVTHAGPTFISIPAGTQLQVRASAHSSNPESIDVAAYCIS